jgi:hypothetical protein
MKRFMNKKVATIAAAVGLTLGLGGVALAYFISTGNGTGTATVGSGSTWSVNQTGSTGTLYPCETSFPQSACSTAPHADQATITFTVTNNSSGAQQITYTNLKSAIDSATGTESPTPHTDITTGGTNGQPNSAVFPTSNLSGQTALNNCQAAWFASSITNLNGGSSNVVVSGGATATVVVTVGMIDSGAPQDACSTHLPNVDLWVS